MKTIFAILGADDAAALEARIQQTYGADSFPIGPGQWIVLDSVTTKDVSDKLGITTEPFASTAVVVAVAGYFGRYPANLWEWLKVKLDPKPNA